MKKILILLIYFNVGTTIGQPANNSVGTNIRFFNSMNQLTSALAIERGIRGDKNCSEKKFSAISVDEWLRHVAEVQENRENKKMSDMQLEDLKKVIVQILDTDTPGKGVMWRWTYENMVQITKNSLKLSGEELCDHLNSSSLSLYQKSIDNLLLSKVDLNSNLGTSLKITSDACKKQKNIFENFGSRVSLQAIPMDAEIRSFMINGEVGSSLQLTSAHGYSKLTVDYTGLRIVNHENLDNYLEITHSETSTSMSALRNALEQRLGAGHKTVTQKELRNVGPSVSYKLRDEAGQAREYNSYMLSVDTGDGVPVFLLGMRESPAEPFRYLRVPADENSEISGFVRLRSALRTAELRDRAVYRYASNTAAPGRQALQRQMAETARSTLELFAGLEKVNGKQKAGLQALASFLDTNVPKSDRKRAGEMFLRILNGVLYELDNAARDHAQVPRMPQEKLPAFMTQAVLSISDAPLYSAPMAFLLSNYQLNSEASGQINECAAGIKIK